MRIILNWLITTLAIMIVAYLLPGIEVSGFFVALVVAVVLGFINLIIRPILLVLTLPINLLTLGLLTFLIDGLLVLLASRIVSGFYVASIWWAIIFAVVLGILNWLLKGSNHNKY